MDKLMTALTVGVFMIAALVLISLLLAFPVMWLWNWLVPTIFGLGEIGLMQAWGLNVLCGLLFKSSSSHSSN